jgi:glucosamine--fructose-6-phosphate aminotransferase (isomerizing)
MCGIAGASLNPTEKVDARRLASSLLLGIEERGTHATGAAWVQNGDTWLSKAAVPASTFVKGDHVPADAAEFIAHTRWATQGSVNNNENNHPIDARGIVGIHNGCIANDDAIFDLIGTEKRIAQVDSEAIFALIQHSGMPAGQALELLRGSAAVAWFDATDASVLHLARVSSSPVVLGFTDKGSLLFASTEKAVRKAATENALTIVATRSMPEGLYHQIRNGEIVSTEYFETQGTRRLSDVERRALNVA